MGASAFFQKVSTSIARDLVIGIFKANKEVLGPLEGKMEETLKLVSPPEDPETQKGTSGEDSQTS